MTEYDNDDEVLFRDDLIRTINNKIEERQMSDKDVENLTGVRESKIWRLRTNRHTEAIWSLEELKEVHSILTAGDNPECNLEMVIAHLLMELQKIEQPPVAPTNFDEMPLYLKKCKQAMAENESRVLWNRSVLKVIDLIIEHERLAEGESTPTITSTTNSTTNSTTTSTIDPTTNSTTDSTTTNNSTTKSKSSMAPWLDSSNGLSEPVICSNKPEDISYTDLPKPVVTRNRQLDLEVKEVGPGDEPQVDLEVEPQVKAEVEMNTPEAIYFRRLINWSRIKCYGGHENHDTMSVWSLPFIGPYGEPNVLMVKAVGKEEAVIKLRSLLGL